MPSIIRPSSTCSGSFRSTLAQSRHEQAENTPRWQPEEEPRSLGNREGRPLVSHLGNSLCSRPGYGGQLPTPHGTEISHISAFTASRTLSRSLTRTPTTGRASHGLGCSLGEGSFGLEKPRRRPSRPISVGPGSRPRSTSSKDCFPEDVLDVQSLAASSCAVSTLSGTTASTLTNLTSSQDDAAPSSSRVRVSPSFGVSNSSEMRSKASALRAAGNQRPWTTGADSASVGEDKKDLLDQLLVGSPYAGNSEARNGTRPGRRRRDGSRTPMESSAESPPTAASRASGTTSFSSDLVLASCLGASSRTSSNPRCSSSIGRPFSTGAPQHGGEEEFGFARRPSPFQVPVGGESTTVARRPAPFVRSSSRGEEVQAAARRPSPRLRNSTFQATGRSICTTPTSWS
jgi:hypothetical protein